MLKYRPVPVSYIDPLDIDEREKLTTDEVDILALLTAMRSDKTEHARNIILRLTGGQIPNRIVETGLKLARQLDPVGQAIPRGRALRLELVTSHA